MADPPIYSEVRGSGSPPLLLVHGFGATGAFWRKWVDGLSPRHQCQVVDLPGFGRSPEGSDPSPAGLASHLSRFIEERMDNNLVLVGHSLGGGIALLAALSLIDRGLRERLAGLVLVSAAVYPQQFPPFIRLARTRGVGDLFLLAPPPRWAIRMGLHGIVFDPDSIDDEQVTIQRAPYLALEQRRSLLRAARAIDPVAGASISGRLGTLRLPTLLIWGEEDRVIPVKSGQRLAQELPSARLVTLPRVGHLPPVEAPSASVIHLHAFMEGL